MIHLDFLFFILWCFGLHSMMFWSSFNDVLVCNWWCFGLRLIMFWPSFDDVLMSVGWCFASSKWKHAFQSLERMFPKPGRSVSKVRKETVWWEDGFSPINGCWRLTYIHPFPTLHRNALWSNALGEMVQSFEVIRMFHRGVLYVIYVIVYVDFSSFFVS